MRGRGFVCHRIHASRIALKLGDVEDAIPKDWCFAIDRTMDWECLRRDRRIGHGVGAARVSVEVLGLGRDLDGSAARGRGVARGRKRCD